MLITVRLASPSHFVLWPTSREPDRNADNIVAPQFAVVQLSERKLQHSEKQELAFPLAPTYVVRSRGVTAMYTRVKRC